MGLFKMKNSFSFGEKQTLETFRHKKAGNQLFRHKKAGNRQGQKLNAN